MQRQVLWLMVVAGAALAEDRAKLVSVFGPGEQTTYEVSYMGVTAGRAELTVGWGTEQFGREVWPLVCVGETTSLGALYPVKDRFITYWDPQQRRTLGADFFVHENKFRAKERYEYDFASSQAIVTRASPGWPTTEKRIDIMEGTVDLAAAGFSLRNLPLEAGQVHELPIFTGVKLYKMKATVVGKELLSTALGDVEVYRVTVNGDFSGKLATQGLMTLYYTTDERRLPVRAEAKLVLGQVRIEAIKYEPGRRYTGVE